MDFPVARPVKDALRAAIDRDDLGYAPDGIPELAAAFAGFAERRMGWRVDPEQVALIPDVMVGVAALAIALAGDAGAVAFASPAYPPFFAEPPRAGLRARPVPLAPGGEFDLDALRAELGTGTRVLLLANPHNPTGRVLPRSELEALAELCAEHDAWVLADEIHAPLVLTGAAHTPWLEVSDAARERGVSLISASKAFNLAGLKAALLVTASDRAREVVAALPPLGDHAGLLGIVGAEAAFAHGDPWLDAVLARLDANRTLLGERLAADLPEVVWSPPSGTYLAWLDCRALGLGDDPADAFLRRGRIALGQGPRYGDPGRGFVRLNFGTSPELVTEAVRRMASAV
ncbi:MAG: aminotransferase class I/II-fold pyridoxal phosphate-dependent enzyme [Actinobacteria bacterium]|nr:aminotransferase class I/II-fold pyridoxal phosphate-dependent enzyme [Actinomycetota bacterium]